MQDKGAMVSEEMIEAASAATARLQRELDITNADHVALWLEANTIPDEPMSQCISWLACRIVDAHEASMLAASPIEDGRLEFRVSFINGKPYVSLENAEEIEAALSHTIRVMREALEQIAASYPASTHKEASEMRRNIARSALGASKEQSK